MHIKRIFNFSIVLALFCMVFNQPGSGVAEAASILFSRYSGMLGQLETHLSRALPKTLNETQAEHILSSNALDAKLVTYVVLKEATPKGLSEFAQQDRESAALVKKLLDDPVLMRRMLVADGAKRPTAGRSYGPAQYGPAIKIYSDIRKTSRQSGEGVLERLALAIALEHAVPISQRNSEAATDAPATIDPLKRYLQYEKAYLAGELDPAFEYLTVWDLRFVVDGNEPDETLVWGREMLRNFRPDHIYNSNYGWRYVNIVASDVRYGSGDVKYDRPELQFFQNILMNGGVCGRRAFFGRFILRAFGIPTTARPSRGHAALAHWTPEGWVVNLGPRWGAGWTKTIYNKDKDFLASTQARANAEAYLKVKRAQWAGDVHGEQPVYGEQDSAEPGFWYGLSLTIQKDIIKQEKSVTLAALGEELGESNETVAEQIIATPVAPEDKKISYGRNGVMLVPAAAYSHPSGPKRDLLVMKSFSGGLQIFLPRFARKGVTLLRGGAWRGGADSCRSGWRMPSSGYGRYNNWGFRVAVTPKRGVRPQRYLKLDLGDGVRMELVYIGPGTFIMGGEDGSNSKWHASETPKHKVTLTKGFYLGKYEVTQAQYKALTGSNPSQASNDPNCPADTISEGDAVAFCSILSEKTGQEARLPTEAEWEYACRAGSTTKYFFGDDPARLGEYAWYDKNDGGTSHPVGRKKPNPWGLYDMYGNVCERVSDTFAKDYYAKSPEKDPTGPKQERKSRFDYSIKVPQSGRYALAAQVVTANYDQQLTVSVNDSTEETTMVMPFTLGSWQPSKPVMVNLKRGENILRFSRLDPPQYGMAIKSFRLKPAM